MSLLAGSSPGDGTPGASPDILYKATVALVMRLSKLSHPGAVTMLAQS